MEIIAQTLDTRKRTVSYIMDTLNKMRDEGKKEGKINLSLDLTKPEYIWVEIKETLANCRYIKSDEEIYSMHVTFESEKQKNCVSQLLDNVENRMERICFEDKCYEAYKLDWMISHGHSLSELFDRQTEFMQEMFDPDDFTESPFDESDIERAMVQGRDQLLYSQGFGQGEIYCSIGEFLENEYTDSDYMRHLLNNMYNSNEMKKLYKRFTGIDVNRLPEFEVPTTAGMLRAYRSTDPGQPGICVMLNPAGCQDEVDCSFVSVYEDPEHTTSDGERPVDVVVMGYDHAENEDCVSKLIIRRENVQ